MSGGLLVTVPSYFGGGFFSPGLDRHGNSVRAVNICRDLSSHFGLHAYADPSEAALGQISAVEHPPAARERVDGRERGRRPRPA